MGTTRSGTRRGRSEDSDKRHLRVRTLLLLVVLVPTLGTIVLASIAGAAARVERDAAARLSDEARELTTTVAILGVVTDEEVVSKLLAIASEFGFGIDQSSEAFGSDYGAQLDDARAALDGNDALQSQASFVGPLANLRATRERLDAGEASFEEVDAAFHQLAQAVKDQWALRMVRLDAALAADSLPAELHQRVDAVGGAFDSLIVGNLRASLVGRLLLEDETATATRELLEAQAHFDVVVEGFAPLLGPRGQEAWSAHASDPAALRFEATIDAAADRLLTEAVEPVTTDLSTMGAVFADTQTWASTLTSTVVAAAEDLEQEAADHTGAADLHLRTQVGIAVLLTLLALAGAGYLARRLTGPVRRLEQAANRVQSGDFDLDRIATDGPKELARTAAAFNEMTATLASVEAHAVALADDPDDAVLSEELPGRTGRALQVALNRLRSSMRMADQQRRELQQLATHDSLTGLLNRAAAFQMIERDLSRSRREGGLVMALFIDLDDLKQINDEHGHAAGDDALRLTAEALRATTRESDIVARLGGDEFLVAGMVLEERAEVGRLADRLLVAIGSQAVQTVDAPVPLRCCVGVAVTSEGHSTVEELVHFADSALYQAKRTGKHRVAWHDDDATARGGALPTAGAAPDR